MSKQDDLNTASAPAEGRWVFDEQVADAFPDMLQRSIPGYADMRDIIARLTRTRIARQELMGRPTFLDLGSSDGHGLQHLESYPQAVVKAIEVSEPMCERLQVYGDQCVKDGKWNQFDLVRTNLAQQFRALDLSSPRLRRQSIDVAFATLTLIFIPIHYRPHVVKYVHSLLRPSGTFFLTEKVQGSDWLMDTELVDTYHQLKHDNGYSWEAIERKRISLEYAQVPVTDHANLRYLQQAGFKHVECVHRHLNFATYMAIA